jgi:uncharacterized protein (DUF1501 family)
MTTIISRRKFLRLGCCSVATLSAAATLSRFGLMSAFAQSAPDYRALVCIFLFGGNDSNNTIVPLDSRYQRYQQVRGGLAIPESTLLPITTSQNVPYGLHPKLPEIQQLYNNKVAAVVANVGILVQPTTRDQYMQSAVPVPGSLFSHSDQQLQWQSSIPNTGQATTGWGGRTADLVQGGSSSSFPVALSASGNSLFLTGKETSAAVVIPGVPLSLYGVTGGASFTARGAAFQQLLTFDSGFQLVQAANAITARGLQIDQALNQALAGAPALKTTFPTGELGSQLQQIAKIIQVRSQLGVTRQIFFASLGGFDTHSAQLGSQGNLLPQMSQAIDALYNATVEMGVQQQVTTFTASDFGRTFQPKSTYGTDHAWGNHHLVIGGSVKGGDLYGQFPTLELSGPDDAIDRGVWIPTTATDQYGATLASWFGVGQSDLSKVFQNLPNFPTSNLGFMAT